MRISSMYFDLKKKKTDLRWQFMKAFTIAPLVVTMRKQHIVYFHYIKSKYIDSVWVRHISEHNSTQFPGFTRPL